MATFNTAQKQKAINAMRQLDIYKPYIEGFEKKGDVCLFEGFGGYWLYQYPELQKKKEAIEKEYGCLVYAVTHELTEFGELYDFLIITKHKQEWNNMVEPYDQNYLAFAYTWNKDEDLYSEFGDIGICSRGGGIKRIW